MVEAALSDTVRQVKAFEQLAYWAPDNVAAAVVVDPDTPSTPGTPLTHGQPNHRFHLASVTKPLFAYAILIAFEEGSLHLEQEVAVDGVAGGVTVAHLLSHSSGLPPEAPRDSDSAMAFAPVESRRIYSNYGFDLLGTALSQATGISAADYLHEAVALPLGMPETRLEGSPAHGAHSTIADMSRFIIELLRPTLISGETMELATQPFLAGIAGVLPGYGRQDPNPWGLGFEIRGEKSPHWTGLQNSQATFGHFGRSGTFIWVDPASNVACAVLTDKDFGPWAAQAWPEFSDMVLAELAST